MPPGWQLWKHRVLVLVIAWIGFAILLTLLDLRANALPLAMGVVAALALAWFLMDHFAANAVTHWPLNDLYRAGGERGNDHSVMSLAARLDAANTRREGRESLVNDLHWQLSSAIEAKLHSKYGFTIDEEPVLSQGIIPPALWRFMHEPANPQLYRPEILDETLQRIEKW